MNGFCTIDDKFVPLHRILWVSVLPHFCGSEECSREGQYEVRLQGGETVWAVSLAQRDTVLTALDDWQSRQMRQGGG